MEQAPGLSSVCVAVAGYQDLRSVCAMSVYHEFVLLWQGTKTLFCLSLVTGYQDFLLSAPYCRVPRLSSVCAILQGAKTLFCCAILQGATTLFCLCHITGCHIAGCHDFVLTLCHVKGYQDFVLFVTNCRIPGLCAESDQPQQGEPRL